MILVQPKNRQQCDADTGQITSNLSLPGFIIKMESLALSLDKLAIGLDLFLTSTRECFMCQEKLSELKAVIISLLDCEYIGACKLASLIGLMSLAIGPVAHLHMTALYRVLNSCRSWSSMIYVPSSARHELLFWNSYLPAFNGQPICPPAMVALIIV